MTLKELSPGYLHSARLIRGRIETLRQAESCSRNAEERLRLQQRIRTLQPLEAECRRLAKLTDHYYDRGYHRYDCYTI